MHQNESSFILNFYKPPHNTLLLQYVALVKLLLQTLVFPLTFKKFDRKHITFLWNNKIKRNTSLLSWIYSILFYFKKNLKTVLWNKYKFCLEFFLEWIAIYTKKFIFLRLFNCKWFQKLCMLTIGFMCATSGMLT